ncbi:MAG: EF-hand domain-containing protein [Rickettsiales bacterium]|nr:EF-hand domain-containing protein [Rickettsiales bacterium]
MKNQSLLILTALLTLSCGTANAQEEGGGERREMMKQKMQERMKEADTNGDGAISKAEFMAQAESRFAKMDANGDGQITQDERGAMRDKFKQMREGGGGGGFGGETFP